MAEVTFQISNMQDNKRAGILQDNLEKYVGGVQAVNINSGEKLVNVTYDPQKN